MAEMYDVIVRKEAVIPAGYVLPIKSSETQQTASGESLLRR